MSMNPFERQAPLPGIKHVVLVGSGKGGVGKSTVAANLALALKSQGFKVGLLDADIYGPSVPRLFGALNQVPAVDENKKIQPIRRHGLPLMSMGFLVDEASAVVWRGPMLFKAMDQFLKDVDWGPLDVLMIDLPPGTGDIAITLAQKVPVSGAVIVTTPQNLALIDAKKAIDMFDRLNVPVMGVIENMAYFKAEGTDVKVDLFPKGDLDSYLDGKRLSKLARVPFRPSIGISCEAGVPSIVADPNSEESLAFQNAAAKLSEQLKEWA